MSESGESYIALCKCGCGGLMILISQAEDYRKEAAKSIADVVRRGYKIQSVADEVWKKLEFGCQAKPKQETLL